MRVGDIERGFGPSEVFQLREADADQEVYGLPEWMPAVQSALLNESVTPFRRKYYNNDSHAGFILYLTDPQPQDGDVQNLREALREALRQSRDPGNFRNLFVHSPNGKKNGLPLIPVSEVAARDEFTGIKSVTRNDMLAALRAPPQLSGIVPQKSGGFGSTLDAATVWAATELAPLRTCMTALKEWLGQEMIRLAPFELAPTVA